MVKLTYSQRKPGMGSRFRGNDVKRNASTVCKFALPGPGLAKRIIPMSRRAMDSRIRGNDGLTLTSVTAAGRPFDIGVSLRF